MASMNDIKRRKASVQSTGQITKAMKLVSTVKLQKAKRNAEDSKEYFTGMYETVSSLLSKVGEVDHPYVKGNESAKKAVLILSSNRGLAGGYNGNIVKEIMANGFDKENTVFLSIGSKGRDNVRNHGFEVVRDYGNIGETPQYMEANQVCKDLLTMYNNGEVGEIYIAYTYFKNTVVHIPTLKKLLPINVDELKSESNESNKEDAGKAPMGFEMDEEEALTLLIPKYITSMIYGGMVQSLASENGARMQAMDSATSNAEDMIAHLTLLYNRARQGSITQELTEIIAGADAIS